MKIPQCRPVTLTLVLTVLGIFSLVVMFLGHPRYRVVPLPNFSYAVRSSANDTGGALSLPCDIPDTMGVYYINRPSDVHRKKQMEKEWKPVFPGLQRVSAVTPNNPQTLHKYLPDKILGKCAKYEHEEPHSHSVLPNWSNCIEQAITRRVQCPVKQRARTMGEIMLTMSNLRAFHISVERGDNYAFILEDDASAYNVAYWSLTIRELIECANHLSPMWGVIRMAYAPKSDIFKWQDVESLGVPLMIFDSQRFYSTVGVIYSRMFMKKMLQRYGVDENGKLGLVDWKMVTDLWFISDNVEGFEHLIPYPPMLVLNDAAQNLVTTNIRDKLKNPHSHLTGPERNMETMSKPVQLVYNSTLPFGALMHQRVTDRMSRVTMNFHKLFGEIRDVQAVMTRKTSQARTVDFTGILEEFKRYVSEMDTGDLFKKERGLFTPVMYPFVWN